MNPNPPPMPAPDLTIFISHKLESRTNASILAGSLSAFGGNRIKALYSANFLFGGTWQEDIEEGLTKASMLILLYEGPQIAWDWCLFETGFFRAKMMDSSTPRFLVCLHSPVHEVPAPLKSFNPVPATQEGVEKLFRQIYEQKPWEISPNLFGENSIELVRPAINRVLSLFQPEKPALYFVGPSFTIHVKKDQIETLKNGQVPPDAFLSGEGKWETIFGKQDNTISWSWHEVVRDLISPEPWIHPLAVLMWQAYHTSRVPYPSLGIRVKFVGENDDEYRVYRLTLKRAEGTKEEVKFAFAVAALVTPYEPAQNPRETALYHLYNLAWFFRRRLLERELKKLDRQLLNDPPVEQLIQSVISDISNDFRTLLADAQVRGMEENGTVICSFDPPLREEVRRQLQEVWQPLYTKLFTYIESGDAKKISETLHSMEDINEFFLKISIEGLTKYLEPNHREH
jgi:hypothetical protein